MAQQQLATGTNVGPFEGVGELHLHESANADGAVARKLMLLAQENTSRCLHTSTMTRSTGCCVKRRARS